MYSEPHQNYIPNSSKNDSFPEQDIFYQVLDSEVFVDLNRLKKCCSNGIPDQLRSIVWKYLLGIEKPDRSNDLTLRKERATRYSEMDKTHSDYAVRIRRDVNRLFQRWGKNCLFDCSEDPARFEAIICAYLNSNNNIEYKTDLIQLCAPFVFTIQEEYDAYYCFESLMSKIEDFYSIHSTNQQVSQFLSWFKSGLPDL
ncbi:hypothetical protein BB561_004278 [Smittium simulii]|uniref:Rab-GAP TBC domain-containing protein n=1 Tax=Smittium simulii TaxID=133385 RepID=A0A2T9YH56_9FUNG|nr:hypothetical protein BB561_004278 [Smittium simulii]